MKGQKVVHTTQVPVLRIFSEFAVSFTPIFFGRCVVEMIVLPRSVASLSEAMYQSAFLSLEFRLNTGKTCASACVTMVIVV